MGDVNYRKFRQYLLEMDGLNIDDIELDEIEIDESPMGSPQPFSSDEAKIHVENDIKQMSKILGKASQQSIKIMMSGVKNHKYDAFDIQRGIVSGNVRDTHTGEREFLRMLWNKVREGFRKYSKQEKLR
ncbi:MAG: hypothetical protein H8E03_00655 [Pelagibacteraceae bacterium]|nr:hypothetical protein [Pelagibacteraceae bacterium]